MENEMTVDHHDHVVLHFHSVLTSGQQHHLVPTQVLAVLSSKTELDGAENHTPCGNAFQILPHHTLLDVCFVSA